MVKPSITCYANPNKVKTRVLMEAFAKGCGGKVVYDGIYRGGPSAFYGVQPETYSAWWCAQQDEHDWYYVDNGYFKGYYQGEEYYRVTKNMLQYRGVMRPNYERWIRLGLHVKSRRNLEGPILLCPPKQFWMHNTVGLDYNEWRESTIREIKKYTDREIVVRWKPANKREFEREPANVALSTAFCVVTFMSNIAVEATLRGMPVFTGPDHCCVPVGNTNLRNIVAPKVQDVDVRKEWAATLAGQQWLISEIESGMAWDTING